jgi:Breast carcinoma amplified sequence 2 (BCAS2)
MQEEDSQAVVVYDNEDKETKVPYVIDSLPFIETLHEDYEEYALFLVDDEMKRMVPPKVDSLAPLKFRSQLLKHDFETLSANSSRNDLPPELVDLEIRATEPLEDTVEAWRQAVRAARAEYETERQRSVVLEIEKSDASTYQWKRYGTMLEAIHKDEQTTMMAAKEAVDVINATRQINQEKVGHTLHLLTSQFHAAVHKRFQLLSAISNLEAAVRNTSSSHLPTTTNETNGVEGETTGI